MDRAPKNSTGTSGSGGDENDADDDDGDLLISGGYRPFYIYLITLKYTQIH